MMVFVVAVGSGDWLNLDGRASEHAWTSAQRLELEGGGHILLVADEQELRIAIVSDLDGWGHIYLSDGEKVTVLHASAALGSARYKAGDDRTFDLVTPFEWRLRETDMSPATLEIRRSYFESEGWVANTQRMGDQGTIEYRIDRRLVDDKTRIAALIAEQPSRPAYWPRILADDTLDARLVSGDPPSSLRFRPDEWPLLSELID